MKREVLLCIFLFFQVLFCHAQDYSKGQVRVEKLLAKALQGNRGGENPVRSITVYLPPGYNEGNKRYPVIYYLHGFAWNDSLLIAQDHLDQLLDKAIAAGKIRETVVVMPDHHTLYRGSYFTNSSLTGNWADFTAREVVTFIDKNYRTIPDKNSRGLAGHSMGGYGALKLVMQYPDVFGAVYAMSPAKLDWGKEYTIDNSAFKMISTAKTREEILENMAATAYIAMGRVYSPNPQKPPFYCDLPVSYEGDRKVVNYDVLAKWEKQSPTRMVSSHVKELKGLNALKLDWGRNDPFPHIPVTSLQFSQELEAYGISHYAEEYIGDHVNKLWTPDGRAYNDMLPFFETYLKFE
ncbi:alpha/beta hydrolase [Botryobacter ruber]|uniref:alpha/beta hydrolase n=1 Tax=Botryobacter ruber TaxID=2171629 RepID=UPI000E0A9895|nr:alpha/beta hydrolase-fold protein [Botryobacter ruber]